MANQVLERQKIEVNRSIDNRGKPQSLPPIQEKIRLNSPYRPNLETPVKPSSQTNPVIPTSKTNPTIPSKINLGSANFGGSDYSAKERGMEEAAYYTGWFLSGAGDQLSNSYTPNSSLRLKRDPLEDLAYEAGMRAANGGQLAVKEAIDTSNRLKEELWKRRPSFEIPKIELPKIKIPGFQIPKLRIPQLQFPELKIPDFKPQEFEPREIEPPKIFEPRKSKPPLIKCSDGFFVNNVDYFYQEENGVDNKGNKTFSKLKMTCKLIKATTKYDGELKIKSDRGLPANIDIYTEYELDYNYYWDANYGAYYWLINKEQNFAYTSKFAIYGYRDRSYSRGTKLAYAFLGGTKDFGEDFVRSMYGVYGRDLLENEEGTDGTQTQQFPKFVRNTTKVNKWVNICPDVIWQPELPKEKPAPPPPPKDMKCEPINYRLIQYLMTRTLESMTSKIEIPVVSCELVEGVWQPKTSYLTLEVFATSIEQVAQVEQLHIANAEMAVSLCEAKNNEAIAAIPDSWLIRPEHHRPQLIFQFAEVASDNKLGSAKYPLNIPHPKKGYKPNECPLPSYKKGSWELIYVLSDNSKVTIHALNKAEAQKVLQACKEIIEPSYLEGGYLSKDGLVKPSAENAIKEITVRPRYCSFFPKGRKEGKPEWRIDFDKK